MIYQIPRRGGARHALYLLLLALALTALGCGESSSGGNFIGPGAGTSGAPAGQGSTTVLRLLFTRARIIIPNSSQVQSMVITLADSAGVTLDRVGPLVISESYDLPVPNSIAERVARVNIELRTVSGVVREVLSSPVTLIPGQITTVESANSTPATLSEITVFSLPGNEPSLPVNGIETLAINGRLQLGVAGTYTAGTYRTTSNITADQFTWASTDPSVANVSQTGLVTGLKAGLVDISATQAGVVGRLRINVGAFTGPSPGSSPTASPTGSPTASPTSSPTASPGSSPTASPGSSPTASPGSSPGASPTPTQPPSGALVLSQTNATTVVGGQVRITGTINGTGVNVTLTSGNTNVASAIGDVLTGVNTGTTNFTATANNLTARGNVTVVTGSLQGTLRLVPGTATSMSEGEQRVFQAFAQFATGNGTVEVDVSNQCVWVVTNTTAQDTGDIISFDAGFGNFTATRGQSGTVQVGAIFSNASAVATANTTVTIARSNPTVTVRPVNSAEIAAARVPTGGWSRLFEAIATYPSGFQKVVLGPDVNWSNSPSTALNNTVNHAGRLEVVTNSVAGTGSTTLTAVYSNSLSGTAGANHTVGIITYTLNNTTAVLAPGLPGDLKVIPGRTSTANGFVRPLTVTCNFTDKNQTGNNLIMTLFTGPGATSASKAGAVSLYLNHPSTYPNVNASNQTLSLFTTSITPVGYTHLLRNVTTGLYNQNTLNVRVQYHPSTPTLAGAGTLSNSTTGTVAEIVGSSAAPGGDRDTARTGAITGLTVDGNTSFQVTVTNINLRRGQGTNATMRASYVGAGAAQEDVTALTDWVISQNAANARIGNVTNGIGEVKGRIYITAPAGGGTGNIVVGGRYPHAAPGGDTANTTVNITLP